MSPASSTSLLVCLVSVLNIILLLQKALPDLACLLVFLAFHLVPFRSASHATDQLHAGSNELFFLKEPTRTGSNVFFFFGCVVFCFGSGHFCSSWDQVKRASINGGPKAVITGIPEVQSNQMLGA